LALFSKAKLHDTHGIDKSEILVIYETSSYFPEMIFADGADHCNKLNTEFLFGDEREKDKP